MSTLPTRTDVWPELYAKLGLANFETPASQFGRTGANSGCDAWDPMRPCRDGERTEHLLRLSGSLVARGYSQGEVLSICRAWNGQNIDKLPDDKIVETCESIGRREAMKLPSARLRNLNLLQQEFPITPLFDLADASIDAFLSTRPPPRRWLLKDFLPAGIVGTIVAPGGTGKSQFTMQLAYAIASGARLADHWEVAESGTVLMICAEDDAAEIHRRLYRIHEEIACTQTPDFTSQLKSRLLVKSVVGQDVLLTRKGDAGEVGRTRTLERLGLTVGQIKDLKLIILDPASRFRGGEENSNEDATRFVEALEWLRQETGATILIIHHTNKGAIGAAEVDQSFARGASAFTDGVRWQLSISAASNKKRWRGLFSDDEQGKFVEAKLVKSNYTAPQPEVLLRRTDGGYLTAVNNPSPSPQDQSVRRLLLLLRDQGPLTAREVERYHGGTDKTLGISQKAVREVVARAVTEGLVQRVSRRPLKLTVPGERLVQELTPKQAGTAPHGSSVRRKRIQ